MLSVTLAFSVFWVMLAVICSMLAVVSSTLAACSLEDWDSDWAVAETWPEALDRLSAAPRTSPMICPSFATMLCKACIICATSSLPLESIATVRSPSAMRAAAAAAARSGVTIRRAITRLIARLITTARQSRATAVHCLLCARALAST